MVRPRRAGFGHTPLEQPGAVVTVVPSVASISCSASRRRAARGAAGRPDPQVTPPVCFSELRDQATASACPPGLDDARTLLLYRSPESLRGRERQRVHLHDQPDTRLEVACTARLNRTLT